MHLLKTEFKYDNNSNYFLKTHCVILLIMYIRLNKFNFLIK